MILGRSIMAEAVALAGEEGLPVMVAAGDDETLSAELAVALKVTDAAIVLLLVADKDAGAVANADELIVVDAAAVPLPV